MQQLMELKENGMKHGGPLPQILAVDIDGLETNVTKVHTPSLEAVLQVTEQSMRFWTANTTCQFNESLCVTGCAPFSSFVCAQILMLLGVEH